MEIDLDGLKKRCPRPLLPDEETRLELLADDAMDEIRMAFMKRGRNLDSELLTVPWLPFAVGKTVREMVVAAILVGVDVGRRSASVAAGQVSESYTFADVDSVSWGGVKLTDSLLDLLGLRSGGARGSFPRPLEWPERRLS